MLTSIATLKCTIDNEDGSACGAERNIVHAPGRVVSRDDFGPTTESPFHYFFSNRRTWQQSPMWSKFSEGRDSFQKLI